MPDQVFIVEDEQDITNILDNKFPKEGSPTCVVYSGREGQGFAPVETGSFGWLASSMKLDHGLGTVRRSRL